ncbi:MAG: hypothetical protein K8S54_15885 [Spirochaetia bacterium]|nr:hypothetical protein [Spirochaetia bacterium]
MRFLYSEINVRRKLIGIFEIQGSGRPIFLLKDFMSMKATDVPIRKGTSTAIATPDEIYRMALEDSGIDAVGCELFFYNELLDEDSAGSEISISSNARMAKKPRAKESNEQFLAEMMSRAMSKVFGIHPFMILFKNVGSKALENVVIIIKISRDDQIEIESDREFKEESKAPSHETPILKTVNSRTVELRWIIERAVPQLLIKLEPFFVRTANVTDIELTARIYANSLADPVSKDLRVKINQKK